jgi:hypothetical protein
MKYIILFGFLLISGWTAAQVPDYFANHPRWIGSGRFNNGIDSYNESSMYYVSGDTMVGNVLYKRLMCKWERYYDWWPSTYGNTFGTFVRQQGREIWEFDRQSGTEKLLVSYDCAVGDSLKGERFEQNGYSQLPVLSIDSVLINGSYRLQFYLDTIGQQLVIEGVGHGTENYYPSMFAGPFSGVEQMECYGQSPGGTLWTIFGPGSFDCVLTSNVDEVDLPRVSIYPNPFNHFFEIKTADQSSKVLRLMDVSGKQILRMNFTAEAHVLTDFLPAGVYVYELQDTQGPAIFGKLIKQ